MACQEDAMGPVEPKTILDILDTVFPPENGGGKSTSFLASFPKSGSTGWVVSAPKNRYDEVYPGIFLGEVYLSKEKGELKSLGITHILNAAQGKKFAQIDTTAETYADLGIQFHGISAMDTPKCNLGQYFEPAAEFIHKALQENGRVFVHCFQGISRSASLVLAYLMIYQKLPLPEGVALVRKKRAIRPNDGFIRQLCRMHNELFSSGDGAQPDAVVGT